MVFSRAARQLALLPVIALVGAGCTTASYVEKPPAAQSATRVATPAPLSWSPCPGEDLAGLQCADVEVPLDYATPDGEKITLAISRRLHQGTDFKGVVLMNPGGPGQSGRATAAAAESLPNQVGDAFDWIGIDTRGVGASKPQVSCIPDYEKVPQPAYQPADEAATQAWIARVAGYAQACKTSAGFPLLEHMTTLDNARDLDSIRRALGVEKVSYWGTSYGTYLGQVFMTQYPQHVDKVILDSVSDPSKGWYQANLNQNVSITKSFRIFIEWVAKHDAALKLGTDPDAILTKTFAKIDDLAAKPPTGGGPGSAELVNALVKAAYGVTYWPMTGQTLQQVLTANDLKALDEGSDGKPSDNNYAGYLGVQCSESTWPDIQTMVADARRMAPDNKLMTWSNTWFNGPCATWPVKPVPLTPVDAAAFTAPFLMVHETFDGATPLSGALAVREKFPASRLLVGKNGSTHSTAFAASPCITDTIATYLSTGAVPARAPGSGGDKECKPATALATD